MAFVVLGANALLLLQLSALLVVVDVYALPLPPIAAPKSPTLVLPKLPPTPAVKPIIKPPPVLPPVKPPTRPPVYPPRKKIVAVQGVVFCKSVCKYRGVNTLLGASPLAGAVVKLVCNNTKNSLIQQKTTDKNGYFFFTPTKLTTADVRKCRVLLVKSPNPKCSAPTNLNRGSAGAILIPAIKPRSKKQQPFSLYTVGPFAFEPAKKYPCH
ncbi:pistil-specific extensin-like protein [Phtheirospermum japonicum]|uniref:Pistil-specific extensin-like protein n=1 Tax=Phtheirospermum japonicum TaxID=374723 RepID=A0A830CAV9_9LAMI|nr:pistil-specific extensin-like protein [Phtheirospermum japonicum]